jgi:hypothetical protein
MLPDEEDYGCMRGRDLVMEADAEEPSNIMMPLLEKLNKISAG